MHFSWQAVKVMHLSQMKWIVLKYVAPIHRWQQNALLPCIMVQCSTILRSSFFPFVLLFCAPLHAGSYNAHLLTAYCFSPASQ